MTSSKTGGCLELGELVFGMQVRGVGFLLRIMKNALNVILVIYNSVTTPKATKSYTLLFLEGSMPNMGLKLTTLEGCMPYPLSKPATPELEI